MKALAPYFEKRDFSVTSEPQGGKAERRRRAVVRDPEARREPPALRLPPRARRHAEELGGAQGAEPRSGRQADGGARRGPSDRLRRLRGHHPRGPVRRRQGHRLGPRHLGAGGRRARRLPRRQAQVPAARREAARRLDAGADARPRQRAPGAVAADQGARRRGAAGRRVQRRRRRAGERALRQDDRGPADEGEGRGEARPRRRRRRRPTTREAGARPASRRRLPTAGAGRPARRREEGGAARGAVAAARDAGAASRRRDAGWIYEIKFDGYRMLARVDGDDVRLFTRRGNDWSERMPALVEAVRALGLGSGWLDGEIVVTGEHGAPDFNALQNAFDSSRTDAIRTTCSTCPTAPATTCASVPLVERRALLAGAARARAAVGARSASARTSTPTPSSCCRTPAGCASKA